jgi:hypothetical protein
VGARVDGAPTSVTAVNDGTADRVADASKGHLLQKREYESGAYLTYLNDSGGLFGADRG